MSFKNKLHEIKEQLKGKKVAPAFNALHTFLYTPNETTHSGGHIRVADDLKRTMNTVIKPLFLCWFLECSMRVTNIIRRLTLQTVPQEH